MLRVVPAAVLLLVLAALPLDAAAKTFVYSHSFATGGYGSSANGTPRGLAVRDGDLLISDALDDQIFRVDPSQPSPAELDTWNTNPFSCAVSAVPLDCTPSQDYARVVRDITWDEESFWVIDKETINGSTTWLIELDTGGNMLRRVDVGVSGANPGGLGYDLRGDRGLVSTDTGSDWVNHFDLDGNLLGISWIGFQSGTPTGITHFGDDLFLVSDAGDDAIYEFELVAGGGTASYVGQSIFQGFDMSTITSIESVAYDAVTQALYVLESPGVNASSVHAFYLVPEPGTGLLLAVGLLGLARRRPGRRSS